MSIKVCNHELDYRSIGMNRWIKTFKHPSKVMGSKVRNSTPPPLYDVYTVDELKIKFDSYENRIKNNDSGISKGLNSILEKVNGLKREIVNSKVFKAQIRKSLIEDEDFRNEIIQELIPVIESKIKELKKDI